MAENGKPENDNSKQAQGDPASRPTTSQQPPAAGQSASAVPATPTPATAAPASTAVVPAPTPPVVTLSLSPRRGQTPKEIEDQAKFNRRHWAYSGIVLLIALSWFINDLAVGQGIVWAHVDFPSSLVAIITVVMVDGYLLCMLASISHRCLSETDWIPLPTRDAALLILLFLFVALVFAFAVINQAVHLTDSVTESLYEAFLTVATLYHDHYWPNSASSYGAVVVELASVMLLLLTFFPMVVARLAMFAGEIISPRQMIFTLKATTVIVCEIHDAQRIPQTRQVTPDGVLNLKLDDMGNIEMP